MDIQEADISAMGRAELEELIDRAVRPDVPLRVLFAALDRYTELLRPVLDDEADPVAAEEAEPEPAAVGTPAVPGPAVPSVPAAPSGPPASPDPPGP